MTEIAKAYVQIIPTTKGIQGQLEKELSGAGDAAGSASGKGFLSGMGGAITKGAAVLGTAATTALSAVAKQSVGSYADFEQLTGGVETLFKSSAGAVMGYAAEAYKTAGLSANQYMETVTSFSASLLQSLGGDTEVAARVGDMAITDMADNANKMGSSMESIQNAYQGFAKQNYTMLDNLKLGYGGTKTEMERLLADAEAFSGIHYDISSLSDVYEAIHVVQGELGITGTTALEASSTISGSFSSMKAAWQNLLTQLGTGEGLNQEIDNLVKTIVGENGSGGLLNNIMPVLEETMKGIGALVVGLTPIISGTLPQIVTDLLPDLLDAATGLLLGLTDGIVANLPMLADTAMTVVLSLCNGIIGNADALMDGVTAIITTIVDFTAQHLPEIVTLALELVKTLALGIVRSIPEIQKSFAGLMGSAIGTIVGVIPEFLSVGKQIVEGVWQGIKNAAATFMENIKSFFKGIVDSAKKALGIASPSKVFAGIGGYMAEGIGVGFSNEIGAVRDGITSELNSIPRATFTHTYSHLASVTPAPVSPKIDSATIVDGLKYALNDLTISNRVYLDSKEIKAGQQRLARSVG